MEPPQEAPKSEGDQKEEATKPSDLAPTEVKSDQQVPPSQQNGGSNTVEIEAKAAEENVSSLAGIPVKSGGEVEAEKDDSGNENQSGNETDSLEMMDVDKPITAKPAQENNNHNKIESSELAGDPVKSEEGEEEEEEDEEEEEESEKTLNPENESKMKSGNGNGSLEKDDIEAAAEIEDNDEEQNGSSRFDYWSDGNESGDEEEQGAFMRELDNFHKVNNLEFKPPKFYGAELNLLKLWRHVIRLGCYEKVTTQKLWRQVGEAFNPPKTCTTVSWTFRIFYEKALLEYEKHKIRNGEIEAEMPDQAMPLSVLPPQVMGGEGSGSGRARRDAATRAMEGWHSHRPLGNGQVSDPFVKERSGGGSLPKRDKFIKTSGGAGAAGSLKRKKPEESDNKMPFAKADKSQMDVSVVDAGLPADWVKINVKKNKDCYEVYALVPGLLREEVQVKSDPAGRLIVSGDPEQPDNPWGVTPFKKVITLPSPIDPHQTSAVVTLHGQLYVRAPFPSSN